MTDENEVIDAEFDAHDDPTDEAPASARIQNFVHAFQEGGGWMDLDDYTRVAAVPGGFLVQTEFVTEVPLDEDSDETTEEVVGGSTTFIPGAAAHLAGSALTGVAAGMPGALAELLRRAQGGGGA